MNAPARRPRTVLPLVLASITLLHTPAHASPTPLGPALEMLDRAAQARPIDPDTSATLGADAAALLAASDLQAKHANPAFQRALGNAHLLAGDLGRATLAFRRAHAADPSDPATAASLAYARSLIDAAPPETRAAAWRRVALAASDRVPRAPVFFGAIATLFAACLLFARRAAAPTRREPGTWHTPTAVTLLTLSGAGAAFLAADTLTTDRQAAVVINQAPARTGPDTDIYPPAFSEPLPPGTEVTIVETRDQWARIRLANASPDTQAWLPAASIETIRPPAPLAEPARAD